MCPYSISPSCLLLRLLSCRVFSSAKTVVVIKKFLPDFAMDLLSDAKALNVYLVENFNFLVAFVIAVFWSLFLSIFVWCSVNNFALFPLNITSGILFKICDSTERLYTCLRFCMLEKMARVFPRILSQKSPYFDLRFWTIEHCSYSC